MRHRLLAGSLAAIGIAVASPAAAACEFAKVAELPVTMRGLRPTITTKINGQEAVFIVDSGAFYSMISDEAAARFGMNSTMVPFGLRVKGVGGGSAAAKAVKAREFQFATATFKNVEFLVGARAGDDHVAGLLGQNILGSMDVEYDLANGYIRFFKATDCAKANLAYWSAGKALSRVPLKNDDGVVLMKVRTTARIDGHPITVNLDSGSPLSVLSKPAAARAGVRPTSDAAQAAGVTYGLFGRGMETYLAPFGAFGIGDEEIRNTQLRIADIELEDADMLLGTDFFLSHRMLVSRSQDKLYFTYNGGPVFKLDRETRQAETDKPTGAAPAAGEATTAAAYSLRGAASAARRDFAGAAADFGRAIELEPKEARHYKDRAMARLRTGQAVLAMADLDEALKLKPDDAEARMARGALYLAAQDKGRAQADFEAAKKAAPDASLISFQIGVTYQMAGRYEEAIREFDSWLAARPNHHMVPQVLNSRCWTRALWGRELPVALADCDAAIKRGGSVSMIMDSRGLVLLRLGRLDEAVAQYDAVIRLQPKSPWSLYGRGLAKLRRGDKAAGDADIAAAKAIQPDILDEAKRYGLAPDTATAAAAS